MYNACPDCALQTMVATLRAERAALQREADALSSAARVATEAKQAAQEEAAKASDALRDEQGVHSGWDLGTVQKGVAHAGGAWLHCHQVVLRGCATSAVA